MLVFQNYQMHFAGLSQAKCAFIRLFFFVQRIIMKNHLFEYFQKSLQKHLQQSNFFVKIPHWAYSFILISL